MSDGQQLSNLEEDKSVPILPTSQMSILTFATAEAEPKEINSLYGTLFTAVQGMSLREMDDRVTCLKRDNFNLKLKLFNIQDRLRRANRNDKESRDRLVNDLHASNTLAATLGHDAVQSKNLLLEAFGVINQLETSRQTSDEKYLNIIQLLKNQIGTLCATAKQESKKLARRQEICHEMLTSDEEVSNTSVRDQLAVKLSKAQNQASSTASVSLLTKLLRECFADIKELNNSMGSVGVKSLRRQIEERDRTIDNCDEKIRELALQNSELMERIDICECQTKAAEVQVNTLMTDLKAVDARIESLITQIAIRDNALNACDKQIEELIAKLCNREEAENEVQENLHIANKKIERLKKELGQKDQTIAACDQHIGQLLSDLKKKKEKKQRSVEAEVCGMFKTESKNIDNLSDTVHGYHNAVNGIQVKLSDNNSKTVLLLDNIKQYEQRLSSSSVSSIVADIQNSERIGDSLPRTIEPLVNDVVEQKLSVMFSAHATSCHKTSSEQKRNKKSYPKDVAKSKWTYQCKSDKKTGYTSRSYAQTKDFDEQIELNYKNKAKTVR